MSPDRFAEITGRYAGLNIAVIGDFCLDRYLEIDPARTETSIETGLPVHDVVNVRSQPGGAGTILNNLVALGVGAIHPIGFCGEDGEGFELKRALASLSGVDMSRFITTDRRRTFTYCKPLLMHDGRAPEELSRLDSKNWSETPRAISDALVESAIAAAAQADAVIVLDQVDVAETGVVTGPVLRALAEVARNRPDLPIIADSRRGLGGFPPFILKMNATELAAMMQTRETKDVSEVSRIAAELARRNQRLVFITLSENGIAAAAPDGATAHVPCLPIRGEIDIVGAGDSVTANLAAALAAGATLEESIALANAAASLVIHQLGTTGTADVPVLRQTLVQ